MLWKFLDRVTDTDPAEDFENAVKARMAATFSVMIGLLGLATMTILVSTREGALWLGLSSGAGGALALFGGVAGVRAGRSNLVMIVLGVMTLILYILAAWANRGGYPPSMAHLPALLMGVGIAWGGRAAMIAMLPTLALFGMVLFWGQTFTGTELQYSPAAQLPMLAAAGILACLSMILFASVVRSAAQVASANLALRNEQLKAALEEAEAANRAKSDFLANMSHEIRTPLNGVLGMASVLLNDESFSAEQRRRLLLINESGENLLDLLNDILDLSKIENRALRMESEALDLRAVLGAVKESWAGQADSKGLDFTLDDGGLSEPVITGDAGRIRQVLNNLLGNAVKFTSLGSITLAVHQARRQDDQVETRFAITDTGIGIAPDMQERIFDSFSQLDSSSKRRFGGTGLGLAISRRLAEEMGGDIAVNSALGAGSTFTVSVVNPVAELVPEKDGTDAGDFVDLNAPARLLVVDDVMTNQLVLKALIGQILRGAKLEIDTASGGREAINMASAKPYNMILMDIQMPGMDGITAMRCIREARSSATTEIVAVTALASEENQQVLLSEGFSGYLPKPVDVDALRAVLRARFAKSETRREAG